MNYKNLLFFNKSGHQTNLIWNGNFWESRLLLPKVSVGLFEIEHFFIIEKFNDSLGNVVYGYPHITPDVSANNSGSGIYGNFKSGSNIIYTDITPIAEYVGAKLFCDQFPNGNTITAVDPTLKSITVQNNATTTVNGAPLFFNLWRSSFETTRNVLDFDAFDSFNAKIISGKDYITTNVDLTSISESEEELMILGDGIPKDARITSISGKNIYLNKICTQSLDSTKVFVYPVEEKNDVSNYIYQYELLEDSTLDAPVLNSLQTAYFKIGYDSSETIVDGVRVSGSVDSSSVSINLALNSEDEGIFGRTLVIEDLSLGYPKIIARIEIHAETEGEDERYKTLLSNFGRRLNAEDTYVLRDADPKEPLTDYEILNIKRKELLLEGHEIFPYVGSYKGLINAIRFFGYQDLRVKEYWLNIKKSESPKTALEENQAVLDSMSSQTRSQSTLIASLLDDENSNKYKQVEIYGKKDDGTYGLKSPIEKLFPSSSFKKTALFGLFYDINRVVEDRYDQFDYPIVENAFVFSPDEVLIKLFGLKEKLKKEYLPLNARIIDITGEGVYFSIYKTRGWIDNLKIDQLNQGLDLELSFSPDFGYIEDLRYFNLRPNDSVPTVPYVGPNPFTYTYSTYGNLTLPSSSNPIISGKNSKKLASAISNFYEERNTSGLPKLNLGDNQKYRKLSDGQDYEVPSGFPTVIEITSFNLSWDELNNKWEGLDRNVSTYSTTLASIGDLTGYTGNNLISTSINHSFDNTLKFGDLFDVNLPTSITYLIASTGKVQLKFTSNDDAAYSFLTEVQTYSQSTGIANLKLLWVKETPIILDDWKVEIVNLFSQNLDFEYYDYSFNSDGFYAWDNLRFAGFYEVEWTITKKGDRPYKYEFRGKISDYYKLPIILPYSGIYSVKCRVWDGFNDICTVHYENSIEVKTRDLEVANVARYREAEVYTWENVSKTWDDHSSLWVFPIEKNEDDKHKTSKEILTPAEYGNQFNEGQECKVLKSFGETIGTAPLKFGLQKMVLSGFTSTYPGGGQGPVLVTINPSYLPHSFVNGEKVTLIDNYNVTGNLSGQYNIFNVTSTGFSLPIVLNSSVTASQFSVIKTGNIKVQYEGRTYANISFNGRLDTTLGNLMSAFNNVLKDPQFAIDTITDATVASATVQEWMEVTFKAPIGVGDTFNGKKLDVTTTGGLYVYNGVAVGRTAQAEISGGVNPYGQYVDFDFNGDLPVENMRYYGTKALNWDAFDQLEWENMYSQTWGSYDFHEGWLGGFSLYNLQSGDKLRVGSKSRGIVLGNVSSPDLSPNYLDLREACDQLNASRDPGISKFTYEVRGFSKLGNNFNFHGSPVGSPLITLAIPYNEESSSYDVQTGASPGAGAATSMFPDKNGDIIMGGVYDVRVFKYPTDFDNYPIAAQYPGSSPRKVQVDEYHRWWCYGENCTVPLVVYDRYYPENTLIFSTSPVTSFANPGLNYIVPLPTSSFQILCLGIDKLTDNFTMYVKYQQTYTISPSATDNVFRLLEFNASTKEFKNLSVQGPVWTIIKTYDQGSIITYNGQSYISLVNTNIGNNPATSPSSWEIIEQDPLTKLDTSVIYIRQLKYEYFGKYSKLWMATNNGIKTYDGVRISSIDISNSGLHTNDVYAITIDETNAKWIGTSDGMAYYDNGRWGCWTPSSRSELPIAKYRNIVNLGNGRIFCIAQTGSQNYKLIYFNGITIKVYDYDPGTTNQFAPANYLDYDYEDLYFMMNEVKYIDGTFTRYPGDIMYLGDVYRIGQNYVVPGYWNPTYTGVYYQTQNLYMRKVSYTIPFIHASSKYTGHSGWDFIYHLSYRPVPDPIYLKLKGISETEVNFNFIVGPLYTSSVNIGKDPQLPYADSRSWKMPHWLNYDFSKITDAHPNINQDDLFLDAPLKDIESGIASKEPYWRNSNLIRSSDRNTGNIIDSFEWVIKIGDGSDDRGMRVFVGEDGYIYVAGYFQDTAYFGAKNNLPSGANTTLSSPGCKSIFVAKYNQVGVIQWARKYGEDGTLGSRDYDYTPMGIKVDHLGNVIVVGYKNKVRNNTSGELPDNLYIKWNGDAQLVAATSLFTSPTINDTEVISDLAIDRVGNVYVAGNFTGTITSGTKTITSATSTQEVFAARIEGDGSVKWLKKMGTGGEEADPSLHIGESYEDLYIAFNSKTGSDQKIYLNRYTSYDFNPDWSKTISNTDFGTFTTKPHIRVSKNGEIALGASFKGKLSVDNISFTSIGDSDIAVFKFNGYRPLWGKNVGSLYSDFCQDIGIDSEGSIFVLGSYSGYVTASPNYSSPNYYPSPQGNLDVIMFKYDPNGTLLDIVDSGGLGRDEGMSISFDKDDNIYLTGYVTGQSNFSNWVVSPGGGEDAFVGKISNLKYKTGKKIGDPFSLFGSQTWDIGDDKISHKEFEVPMGSTVVFNPIDSLIPGKRNHVWKLVYDASNEEIINVKDVKSFIWTFNKPGFYSLYLQVEDSNGNLSIFDKKGYIRVIDHKNPPAGEVIEYVNSEIFRKRAIYEAKTIPQLA
jgi:hypothetical protein